MKLLFDFFPIIFFFVFYKFFGIYVATSVAILASFAQLLFYWLKHRRFELTHVATFALIVLLGGATLFFKNAMFIKWKPTAIYWVLALAFLISHFVGKKTIIQKMLDKKLDLPSNIWRHLNLSWIIFFTLVGMVNLYVVYHYSTDTWVNFKLFGVLGLTILFGLLQSLYMSKYLENKSDKSNDE